MKVLNPLLASNRTQVVIQWFPE